MEQSKIYKLLALTVIASILIYGAFTLMRDNPAKIFKEEVVYYQELAIKNFRVYSIVIEYNCWGIVNDDIWSYGVEYKPLSRKELRHEIEDYKNWLNESVNWFDSPQHGPIEIFIDKEEKVIFITERVRTWEEYLGTIIYYWSPLRDVL